MASVFSNALNKDAPTIVKLCEGDGPPLIVLHGGLGSIHAFGPLQKAFKTTLWAIQVTRRTPRHSIEAQTRFYYEEIIKEQKHGPYRICAFSGSSIFVVGIVRLLESDGRKVEQLSFIDHFPTTYTSPVIGLDLSRTPPGHPQARDAFLNASIDNLLRMTRADMRGLDPKRQQMANDLEAAFLGQSTTISAMEYKTEISDFLNRVFDFISSLHHVHHSNNSHTSSKTDFMENWMQPVQAPVTMYLATYGMLSTYKPDNYPPAEWHVWTSFSNVTVTVLEAGHYDILSNEALHRGLQGKYLSHPSRSRL